MSYVWVYFATYTETLLSWVLNRVGDVFVSLGDSDPRSCVCTGVCSVSLAEVPLRLLFLVVASCWCGFAYARGCCHLPTIALLGLGSPGLRVAGIVVSNMLNEIIFRNSEIWILFFWCQVLFSVKITYMWFDCIPSGDLTYKHPREKGEFKYFESCGE